MPARSRPWIDVTMEFGSPGGTWPGDAPFEVAWTARRASYGVNLARFSSSPHNGTHSDAPYHVDDAGAKSEALPLANYLGPCRVVDARRVRGSLLPAHLMERARGTRRVLFRTRSRGVPRAFPEDYKGLSRELGEALAEAKVLLVGTDAPSVDRAKEQGLAVHRRLFRAGTAILENLDLSRAPPGPYDLVALPLKVRGLCAAPVRALLRRRA